MQPVVISDGIAIANGSVNLNVIAQNDSLLPLQRAPFTGRGKLVATRSADGLKIAFQHGDRKVVAVSDITTVSGSTLEEPTHVVADNFYVEEGEVLLLLADNASGGSINLVYRLELIPLVGSGPLPPDTLVQLLGPISVSASTTDQQILQGTDFERPPKDAIGSIYMTSSTDTGTPTRQVYVDMQRIAPQSHITPSNRVPTVPFDISVGAFECPKNKLIQIPVSWGATGGSVFLRLQLQNLSR